MKKFTLNLKRCILCCATVVLLLVGFKGPEEDAVLIQSLLNRYYDPTVQQKELKRFELNVTNTGFCRFRKIYTNGKTEYFAFNLSRFRTMDYYGSETRGQLYLRTKNDDVIVQTRNDRKGEVDSTAMHMIIPLRNVSAEQLHELQEILIRANTGLLSANK